MVRLNSWDITPHAESSGQELWLPFPTSSLLIPMSGNEDEFKQRARLMAYQQLLYRMFGSSFECVAISGGFSGSSVVKITPFDALGNREEAVIVKLDSAQNIRVEVAHSIQAQAAIGDIAARVLGEPIYIFSDMDGMEYGGFKVELAGAVLQVPELSAPGTHSPMINTFKDLVIFECEEAVLTRVLKPADSLSNIRLQIDGEDSDDEENCDLLKKLESGVARPYGSVLTIVKELFGLDGSATRSLRRFEGAATTSRNRRISISDPNHPAGGDFLASRLPSEFSEPLFMKRVFDLLRFFKGEKQTGLSPYEQINDALIRVRSSLSRTPKEWRILRGFSHGDLNGSNIIVDAMEGMWLIDFATAKKLPLTADLAKLETCLLFEYSFIPVPIEYLVRLAGSGLVDIQTLATWFRVSVDSIEELVAQVEKRHSGAEHKWTEDRLDCIISHVSDIGEARKLRARLVADESVFWQSIDFAKSNITACLVPRTSPNCPPNIFRSVVDMAESRRDLAVRLPPSLHAFSLPLQAVEKLRHYCLSDIEKLFKAISEEDESTGIYEWDVSPIEFSVMLLRESARLVRYNDVPPWMKMVVGEFGQELADLIVTEVDRLLLKYELANNALKRIELPSYSQIVGMSRTTTPTDEEEDDEFVFSDEPGVEANVLGKPNAMILSSSMSDEGRKYYKHVKAKFGFLIDFVSGRQLDVVSQCCDLRLSFSTTVSATPSIVSIDHLLTCSSLGIVVSGIPGSGKSFLLRRLLVDSITLTSMASNNGWKQISGLVPIFVSVNDWIKTIDASSPFTPFGCCLDNHLRSQFVDDDARSKFVRLCLRKKRAIVLVDGLDDAGPLEGTYSKIVNCLTSKVRNGIRVVVTSRRCQPEGLSLFSQADIMPLDRDQRRQVVKARLAVNGGLGKFESFFDSVTENDRNGTFINTSVGLLKSPAFLSMLLCYWSNVQSNSVSNTTTSGTETPAPTMSRQVTASSGGLTRLTSASGGQSALVRTTTSVDPTDLILQRTISPSGNSGSSLNGPSVVDVYRVAVSVLVHRYQVLQESDRSRVRESARRTTELLRLMAFTMKCNRRDWCCDTDFSTDKKTEGMKLIVDHVSQGRFSLLEAKQGTYRFCLSGMLDVLAGDHLIHASEDATTRIAESLSVTDLVSDLWWVATLSIVADKAPMKYVRLIERKLMIVGRASQGSETCLHLAARAGHLPFFKILSRSSLLESLIDRPNTDSLLPIHEAARSQSQNASTVCRLLIASRADVWATTADGWCALHFAASFHNRDVCAALLEEGRTLSSGTHIAGSFSQLPQLPRRQLARLSDAGLGLASKIIRGELKTSSQFIAEAKHVFPELSYFRGRSDTTPDASASVSGLDPSEIEYRRTVGAMLSVFWIVADKYEEFVSCQPPTDRLSVVSWNKIRRWTIEFVELTSPEAVDAMLCLMAVHDLGKLKDFRDDLAKDYKDHDAAMRYIMSTTPEVLPSLCRLPDTYQQTVKAALGLDFNFGQFLQAENLPANLVAIKDLIATKGQATLAFYLFHIFADMAGIMGAVTLEGSAFMTETMYSNFALGIEALSELSWNQGGVEEVYSSFLKRRGLAQGFVDFNRELVRLACLGRMFDPTGGQAVVEAWRGLDQSTQAGLLDHLSRTGIRGKKLPAFLLYYAPAFMENAKNNPSIGLRDALKFLLRIYQAAEKEFSINQSVVSKPVVVVHIAQAAELAKKPLLAPKSLDSVCFRIVRSGGSRRLNEATVKISPWYRLSSQSFGTSEEIAVEKPVLPTNEMELDQIFPETSFVSSKSKTSMVMYLSEGDYASYMKRKDMVSMLSSKTFFEFSTLLRLLIPRPDQLELVYILCALTELDSVGQLRIDLQLSPGTRLWDMVKQCPSVFPSFQRMNAINQEMIINILSFPFLFETFVNGERVTEADVTKLRQDMAGDRLSIYLGYSLVQSRAVSESFIVTFRQAASLLASQETPPHMIVEEYLRFRGDQQGILSQMASPRHVVVPTIAESEALVRLACLARVYVATGSGVVQEAFSCLSSSQRAELVGMLSTESGKTGLMSGLSDFLSACKLNSSVGLDSGLRVLLRLYARLKLTKEVGAGIDLSLLTRRAERHAVQLPFSDIAFEISGLDRKVYPQTLIPCSVRDNHVVVSAIQSHVSGLTSQLVSGVPPDTLLFEDLIRAYPELDAFNLITSRGVASEVLSPDATVPAASSVDVERDRTVMAIQAVVWVLTNQYEAFNRLVQPGQGLSSTSWMEIREWLSGPVLANPDTLDALIVLVIVTGITKLTKLDVSSNQLLFPSFARLSLKYKALVESCLGCKFNFGQFLQAESREVLLGDLQTFVRSNGTFGLEFLLACNFALQAGLKGNAFPLFMNEAAWRTFRTGKEALGVRPDRDTAEGIYHKYLLRRGGSVLTGFRGSQAEFMALCRLVCLARISSEVEAAGIEIAFDDLDSEHRSTLTKLLTSTSGPVVTYLPSLIENIRLNVGIPPSSRLTILTEVLSAVQKSMFPLVDSSQAASWAREVQLFDAFDPKSVRFALIDSKIIVQSPE